MESKKEVILETAGISARPIELERVPVVIRASRMSYVMFEKPDLSLMERFLVDFGMIKSQGDPDYLAMRGTESSPYLYIAHRGEKSRFMGFGVEVDKREDLETLRRFHSGSVIERMDEVSGGERLRLQDPNGFVVDVVHGRHKVPRIELGRPEVSTNRPGVARRVDELRRAPLRPAPIARLGHVVLGVGQFALTVNWLMRNLGMIPSDVQYIANGEPGLAFLRFDRGNEPTDHHSVVALAAPRSAYLHSAFETTDIDAIGQGAQVLRAAGWRHVWGIGRHLLGSQIFNYWQDPFGQEVEHYADGDLLTATFPTVYTPASTGGLWSWGDDVPSSAQPVEEEHRIVENPSESALHTGLKQAFAMPGRPWLVPH